MCRIIHIIEIHMGSLDLTNWWTPEASWASSNGRAFLLDDFLPHMLYWLYNNISTIALSVCFQLSRNCFRYHTTCPYHEIPSYTMAGRFEPKEPVQLAPPKDDPITVDELAKNDGRLHGWLSAKWWELTKPTGTEGQKAYVAIKVVHVIVWK